MKRLKEIPVYSLLFIVPLLLFTFHLYFNQTIDDYRNAVNVDPDYAYLLSSVDISNLGKSKMVVHPGTTCQVLNHLVMRCAHYFAGNGENEQREFRAAVLENPVFYLDVLHRTSALINIILVLVMGILIYRMTRQFAAALIVQFTPLLSSNILLSGFRKVTSDVLLTTVTLVLVLVLLKILQAAPAIQEKKTWYKYALILGVLSGFGIATKITFLVLIVIPLLLIPSIKSKMLYLGSTLLGAFVFTLPIVERYAKLSSFLKRIFTHKGAYGHGEKAILDLEEFLFNFSNLVVDNLAFVTIVLISSVLIVVTFKKRGAQETIGDLLKNLRFRLLVAVTSAQWLGILVVARHYKSRYLIPFLCLSGLVLYLLYLQYDSLYQKKRTAGGNRNSHGNRSRRRLSIASIIFLVLSLTHAQYGVMEMHSLHTEKLKEAIDIRKKLETEYKDYGILHYYSASSVSFGLMFGNNWTPIFADDLRKLYGDRYFYQQWMGTFSTWSFREKIPLEKIKKKYNNKIIFYGTPFRRFRKHIKRPPVKLNDLYGGKHITIYNIETDEQ